MSGVSGSPPFNSLSRDHPNLRNIILLRLQHSFNSLSRDHLWLTPSIQLSRRPPFNSLSRDHFQNSVRFIVSEPIDLSTPSLGITVKKSEELPVGANTVLSTPSLGITNHKGFQPGWSYTTFNSLSRDHRGLFEALKGEIAGLLSTSSLGITKNSVRASNVLHVSLSTPSLGITESGGLVCSVA